LAKIVQTQNKQPVIERREIRGNLAKENGEKFINQTLEKMATLQAHKDVIPALQILKENGFKTVAFSNSSSKLIQNQIKNSGLDTYFDEIISVESTGSFKPHEKVYRFAAVKLAEPIENLRLIACHDWDTHGALSAGMKAAYLNRSQTAYNPLYQKTDIKGDTMIEIAERIVTIHKQREQKT
jgi:2-haloacid dehalogenase